MSVLNHWVFAMVEGHVIPMYSNWPCVIRSGATNLVLLLSSLASINTNVLHSMHDSAFDVGCSCLRVEHVRQQGGCPHKLAFLLHCKLFRMPLVQGCAYARPGWSHLAVPGLKAGPRKLGLKASGTRAGGALLDLQVCQSHFLLEASECTSCCMDIRRYSPAVCCW